MTKYSTLSDREETTALLAECKQAVNDGFESAFELGMSDKARRASIMHHINALAFTWSAYARANSLPWRLPLRPEDDESVSWDEYLNTMNLEYALEHASHLRIRMRGENKWGRVDLAKVAQWATKLLELLPAE